jgi:hypothetical protein
MRMFPALLLLSSLCAPALAETPAAPAPDHHGRRSAEQHFADANTSHDGRLSLDQATAGYKSIAKSFNQIDVNHHGYVTMDDIKAWKAAKKAAKQAAKRAAADAADGVVRPGPAARQWMGPKALETSTDMIVPMPPVGSPRTGVDMPKAPLDGNEPS